MKDQVTESLVSSVIPCLTFLLSLYHMTRWTTREDTSVDLPVWVRAMLTYILATQMPKSH